MFGLAQSQKMDGKSFCRNFLDLVWFSAYVVRREVGVSLYQIAFNLAGGSAFEALQMELIVVALQGRLCLGPHFECLG